MSNEKLYGFRSQQAIDRGYGTAWYSTPEGVEVEVTAVCDNPEGAEFNWLDKVSVGEVVKFARASRPALTAFKECMSGEECDAVLDEVSTILSRRYSQELDKYLDDIPTAPSAPVPITTVPYGRFEDVATLRADKQRLREALIAVTPPHRVAGECWCGIARDIETYGHESRCLLAQAALEQEQP